MSRIRIPLFLLVAVLGLAGPAAAIGAAPGVVAQQEGGGDEAEPSEPAPETTAPAPDPAVPVEEEAEPPQQVDWTYRYLVPTALLLGVLTVLAVIIGYFVKVTRSRYRIVE